MMKKFVVLAFVGFMAAHMHVLAASLDNITQSEEVTNSVIAMAEEKDLTSERVTESTANVSVLDSKNIKLVYYIVGGVVLVGVLGGLYLLGWPHSVSFNDTNQENREELRPENVIFAQPLFPPRPLEIIDRGDVVEVII